MFETLNQEKLEKIADIQLKKLQKRAVEQGIQLSWDQSVSKFLSEECGKEGGARSLRHLIQEKIEVPLAQLLLEQIKCQACKLYLEGCDLRLQPMA